MIQTLSLNRASRVLILSASSGAGHVRAARAIVEDALGLLH
jgi:hypothetical protein